jgi:hypothetical protein
VQLWLEEAASGGRTFTMLKRFHDRTTRWMSPREKGCLGLVAFLDVVNKATVRRVADEGEPDEVFHWFEGEASVRDPSAGSPRVREYVRSRLRDYLEHADPERCAELRRKAVDSA